MTYSDLKQGDTFNTLSGEHTVIDVQPASVPGCLTITHRRTSDGTVGKGTVPAHGNVL